MIVSIIYIRYFSVLFRSKDLDSVMHKRLTAPQCWQSVLMPFVRRCFMLSARFDSIYFSSVHILHMMPLPHPIASKVKNVPKTTSLVKNGVCFLATSVII